MTMHNRQVILEDVLNEYVASSAEPNKEILEEWLHHYPQYEQELLDFTISWSLMEQLPPYPTKDEVDEETLVLRGMSIVQNLLHQRKIQDASDNKMLITSLLEEGSKHGLGIPKLAELSRLSSTLIRKLDLRRILYTSIPDQAIHNIARVIQCSYPTVAHYLQGKPKPMKALYKAQSRPTSSEQQEDFFDAVKNDFSMDEETRQYWLSLKPR